MRQRQLTLFLLVSTLLLVGLILSDGLPYLRGPAPDTSEWHWPYELRPFSRWGSAIGAAIFIWLSGSWWLWGRPSRGKTAVSLSALVGGNIWLQLSLIYAQQGYIWAELINRTLSDVSSGYLRAAADIEQMAATLRHYPAIMPTFAAEHAQTHPPGLIMANWLTIETLTFWPNLSNWLAAMVWPERCTDLWLFGQPPSVAAGLAVWSVLPLFVAALTPLPAYGLARHLLPNQAARLTAVLTATIPALILFAPTPVQFYPFLALTILWLIQMGVSSNQYSVFSVQYSVNGREVGCLVLAGLLLSVASFLSLGNGVLALLITLYIGLWAWWRGLAWPQGVVWLLLVGLASLTVWLLYWLFTGVPPWQIMQVGLNQHYELVTFHRRYSWWLLWNLIDLLLFAGWPLFVGFIGGLLFAIRKIRAGKETAVAYPAVPFILALLLFITILNLSGTARGEVGRLWAFVMPLMAMTTAVFITYRPLSHRKRMSLSSQLIGLQLLVVIALGVAWQPMEAVIVVAERPEMAPFPADAQPIEATWGETISLRGYQVEQTESSLQVTYVWYAHNQALRPYTTFNHLLNETGDLVAQTDQWAVNGRWPPSCWQPGQIIVDQYELILPPALPPGKYTLWLGMYDAQENGRFPLADGTDSFSVTTIIIGDEP